MCMSPDLLKMHTDSRHMHLSAPFHSNVISVDQCSYTCVIIKQFTQLVSFSSLFDVHSTWVILKWLWWDLTDSQPAVNHHMAHQLAILIVNLTSFYDNHEHREILIEALA